MNLPGNHGATLLQCRERPLFAVVGVVVGVFLMAAFGLLSVAGSDPGKSSPATNVFVLMLGIAALATSLYSLAVPAVLFEVTQSGIMLYANPSTSVKRASESIAADLFIPWERIESMYFLTRKQVLAAGLANLSERGLEGGNPLVVLKIRRDLWWPPHFSLRRPSRWTRNARPDEIYLNAYYGTVRGERLYHQLEELRARCTRLKS